MFNESDDDLDIDEDTLRRGLDSYLSLDFLHQIEEGERSTINLPDRTGADSVDDLLQQLENDGNDVEIRSIIDDNGFDGNDPMDVVVASEPSDTETITIDVVIASVPVVTEPISIELQSLLHDIRQGSGMNHPNVSDHILVSVLLDIFIQLLSSLPVRPHSNNDILTDVIYYIERQNPSSRISKLEAQKVAVPEEKSHKRKDRPTGLKYEKKSNNGASNPTKASQKKGHQKQAPKKKADDASNCFVSQKTMNICIPICVTKIRCYHLTSNAFLIIFCSIIFCSSLLKDEDTKIAKNFHRDFDGNGGGSCGGLVSV